MWRSSVQIAGQALRFAAPPIPPGAVRRLSHSVVAQARAPSRKDLTFISGADSYVRRLPRITAAGASPDGGACVRPPTDGRTQDHGPPVVERVHSSLYPYGWKKAVTEGNSGQKPHLHFCLVQGGQPHE